MKEYANELERLRDVADQMKRDPYFLEKEEQREKERKELEEQEQKKHEFKQHNLNDIHKEVVQAMKELKIAKQKEMTPEQIEKAKDEQSERVYRLLEKKHSPNRDIWE